MGKSREEKIKERLPELESIASSMEAFSKRKAPLHVKTEKLKKHHKLFNEIAEDFSDWARECKTLEDTHSLLKSASAVQRLLERISRAGGTVSSLAEARTKIDRLLLQIKKTNPNLEEEFKKKTQAQLGQGIKFSSSLFPFSKELLEGGAASIGLQFSRLEPQTQEAVRNFFEQKRGVYKITDWDGAGSFLYYFKGSHIKGSCSSERGWWGVNSKTFFVCFGPEWARDDGNNIFANLAWMLPLVGEGCSFNFYPAGEAPFKKMSFGSFLDFFNSAKIFFGGKEPEFMGIELRMGRNMPVNAARAFFNGLVSYEFESKDICLATARGAGVFDFKEGGEKLFAAGLSSYEGNSYEPFLNSNRRLWSRMREIEKTMNFSAAEIFIEKARKTRVMPHELDGDKSSTLASIIRKILGNKSPLVLLDEDYEVVGGEYPKIGGAYLFFNLKKGQKYVGEVKKYFDFVLSLFADMRACASKEMDESAVAIHFLL